MIQSSYRHIYIHTVYLPSALCRARASINTKTMSYNSRAPSNIGMISTTVNCRTSVTHWTEAEKEKWLAGVKDGALDAMNTMSEHMETGKSPEDCHAFMDLIHEHAGRYSSFLSFFFFAPSPSLLLLKYRQAIFPRSPQVFGLRDHSETQ